MRFVMAFGVALVFAPPAPAQQPATTPPAIEIKTKAAEISITIDAVLKAHPGLYENCLAEGKRYAAKWRADAEAEFRVNPQDFSDGRYWSLERHYGFRSAVGRYISVLRTDATYSGGAHPNSYADTILWDRAAKKRISIRPFFNETADNGPTMTALARLARLAVAIEKMERHKSVEPDSVKPGTSPEDWLKDDDWISRGIQPSLLKIGPISLAPSTVAGRSSGFTFHYSPYAVDAYAAGPYTAFVPWAAFQKFLSPEGLALFGGTRPTDDDKW
jgi:hypothetical protein